MHWIIIAADITPKIVHAVPFCFELYCFRHRDLLRQSHKLKQKAGWWPPLQQLLNHGDGKWIPIKKKQGFKLQTPCVNTVICLCSDIYKISGSSPDSDVSSFKTLSGHLDVLGKRPLMIYSTPTGKKLWFRLSGSTYKQMLMETYCRLLCPMLYMWATLSLSRPPASLHPVRNFLPADQLFPSGKCELPVGLAQR